uniref:SecY-independent transporter protein n=1 Tax=Cocconeiopsis kantsiensis TaxID=3082010 RepID=UPI003001ECC7
MKKYFKEISKRATLLFLTFLLVLLVNFFYKEIHLFLILKFNVSFTKIGQLDYLYFIFTDVTEILSAYITLIFFTSVQIFCLYFIYHTFYFFSSAFFKTEYTYIKLNLAVLLLFWLFLAVIINKYLIPSVFDFFFSFQQTSNACVMYFESKLNEYLHFYTVLYYMFEFYFQFILIFLILLNSYFLNLKTIKKLRKVFYCTFCVLSTIVSPPEVIFQVFLSAIVVIIYEIFVFLSLLK